MAVRIVTDSTADIPLEQAQALGITVVPLTVFFGEEAYLDGVELDNASFYAKLQTSKVLPRTSQPSPVAFQQAYTRLIDEGADGIIAVLISAKLSGTFQSACTARDALPDDLRKIPIEMIDSESASIVMGMSIMKAAEEAQHGLGLAEIKTNLLDRLSRTRIFFVLDTLEYLKRGGRISGAQALMGNMLSIKPILTFKNGEIVALERPRTRGKAYVRIAQMVGEFKNPEEMVVVASDENVGQQLVQVLQSVHVGDILIYKLGAVVGTYAGPGTAGVAFITARSV
jgi:DegV family protein with EDD domain